MLQIQDLVKIYKPKKGVPVRALDGVSLTLPEKGMVFLLGKSGSGKSTLLNIMGGLDRYNTGEFLVMGKSTKKWGQRHFDSYRNTYVGFIFQEYNIIDEFSVGANIALALQLQGHKPSSEQINTILKEVDLDGFGNRNPNELSGGQKQRVAIARALVKNPKIIMADEPTGALDSTTGRQVLNTLKKLSRDKLVVIVSHDREFAEQYADRIVELADGRIIRDVERLETNIVTDELVPVYMEDSVSLPEEYVLTEADKEAICAYIQKMVNVGKQPRFSLFSKNSSAFQPTDESRIPQSQEGYKLIKSKLPLKFAFKLGASGLKHKKFRLIMTIFLSCIALGLFGLTDTLASYDYVTTAYRSLMDPENKITYAAFEKEVVKEDLYYYGANYMTEEDIELIEEKTGMDIYPVYSTDFYLGYNLGEEAQKYYSSYYMNDFTGCIVIDEDILEEMGAELVAGKLPTKSNEIAISTHMLETFEKYGYVKYSPFMQFYPEGNIEVLPDGKVEVYPDGKVEIETQPEVNTEVNVENKPISISKPKDIIGLTLWSNDMELVICGVIDTGMDMDRYQTLKDLENDDDMTFIEQIAIMALESELHYARRYSLDGLMMVSEGYIKTNSANRILRTIASVSSLTSSTGSKPIYLYDSMKPLSQIDASKVIWLDGTARTALANNEIVLSREAYTQLLWEMFPDGMIPEEYDFYRIKENNAGFEKLTELSYTLEIKTEEYAYYEFDISGLTGTYTLKLVGILDDEQDFSLTYIVPDKFTTVDNPANILQTLSPMPTDPQKIRALVEFSAIDFDSSEDGIETYNLMNPVTFELKSLDSVFNILKKVFFWIALVFVVFASLLFSNFITTSISYKKEEIGILRAIGSRGNDVFRIFFAESFIIAMINFVLSFVGTLVVCLVVNALIKTSTGMLLTVLNIGIRQALLLLGICLLSAFIACYLPVRKIAAKRPIDAIRDR